ncbi:MAG: hypothetical protein ACLUEK_03165 [Oscillospiraceae bacterium]
MKVEEYAAMRTNTPCPPTPSAPDRLGPDTGDVIAIGIVTRRRTYNKTGYICQKDAPAELHACACALLELVQDMPVIKTALLRPEDVCARLCGDETPDPSLLRHSALALAALCQSLQACLSTRGDVE